MDRFAVDHPTPDAPFCAKVQPDLAPKDIGAQMKYAPLVRSGTEVECRTRQHFQRLVLAAPQMAYVNLTSQLALSSLSGPGGERDTDLSDSPDAWLFRAFQSPHLPPKL